ncbi:MAG: hypothetical protein F9K23_17845 [Bacteroidetes bacterium]|nr:MAG: hypothetical protein F9K23_17845 [Bacteroidota bacterium]
MSRSLKKANELLFDLIKMRFDVSIDDHDNTFNHPRWVWGDNIDQKWLCEVKFKDRLKITQEAVFSIAEFEGDEYFVVTGFSIPDNIPQALMPCSLNPGLFVGVIYEFELPVLKNISNDQLVQNILSQHKNLVGYEGHELNDLLKIFPNIFVMKISGQYLYSTNQRKHQQLIAHYLSINKKFINLPFSNDTLEAISNLVLLDSKILKYENIIQALLSFQFKFAFLDLYRCIEMLYQIVYINEPYNNIFSKKGSITKLEFLEKIEFSLNWRPNERNTLNKIFEETPGEYKKRIKIAAQAIDGQAKANSNWLYDLRCSIVHLKANHREFELTPYQWDKIILGTVDMLLYWYSEYINFE